MAFIFHIISKVEWTEAQKKGVYSPASLCTEGFIHCSRTDQIKSVADSFYRGKSNLILLRIDQSKVLAEIKDEPPLEAPMSGVTFPHIYGELNLDAVVAEVEFPHLEDGSFVLPSGILKA